MENFINDMKIHKDFENKVNFESIALQLIDFEKEVDIRKSMIEEEIISGEYYKAKMNLATLGVKIGKLHENIEEMEKEEKKDCGCIENITEEEFNVFLKEIGGLESGYREGYWGQNKVRKLFFNITSWFLWKLPTYQKSKTFSKESNVMIFLYNMLYWICKPILKDQKPKNPFRSKIYDCGSFSIGPGWYGLVMILIDKAVDAGWNKEICQVKEKFGTLRFYINGASTEVHNIISKYENLSYKICEDCGSAGEQRTGGWIRTLCDTCFNKLNKKE